MFKRFWSWLRFPAFLLILCIASYGLLASALGFYWDDWPMVWFAHTLGPAGFTQVFSSDRPFLAGIYVITTALFQTSPLPWQIFGLVTRWLTALAVYWTVQKIWPERRMAAAWVAVLFAVFPGFKQQPISVVYSNGFILLASYILSLGCMLAAVRQPQRRWLWTVLGVLTFALCTFSTEYYVGLDLIRPILLWLVLREYIPTWKERAKSAFFHWLPYLGAMLAFLIWRVFVFEFPTYQPELIDAAAASPVAAAGGLLYRVVQDVFTSSWLVWALPFRFPALEDFANASGAAFWLITAASLLLTLLAVLRFLPEESAEPHKRVAWSHQAMIVGGLAMLFAGWPFWITNLPLGVQFPWDRFSLAFMLGSCIFAVGLLEWLLRKHLQRVVLLSLVVAMAVGSNFETANSYRREWITQKDFFWQLSWRAPALKPNTLLVTQKMPLIYYSDNSLTAPLNWLYAPDNHTNTLPYFLAFTEVRLGAAIPALEKGLPVVQEYRSARFESSTDQALVYFYSPPGCLRLLSPSRDDDLPILPREVRKALKISHLNQVIPDPASPASPPAHIFGAEPEHGWCYYYQKADLARQTGNWEQVVSLGEEAFSKGFEPAEPSEYMLFVEGYARAGRWQPAADMAVKTDQLAHSLQSPLCRLLSRLEAKTAPQAADAQALAGAREQIECPQ